MRKFFMLAAAVLAALPPAVAAAGHGDGSPSVAADPAAFRTQMASGSELTFPLPDAPGPAALAPGAQSLVDHASPGALLDLVVTLDRPADHRMVTALSRLGVWSQTFEHLPAAGIRLPLARLTDLRNLRGVLAIYDDHPLHYFLKDSAKLNNTAHAWNDLKVTGKGVTVAILDTGVDFTHPDLAPAMKANVKLVGLGQDPLPVVPIAGIPNSDTSSGHGTHVAGDVAGRGIASGGAQTSSGSGRATACRSSPPSRASTGCSRTGRSTASGWSTTPTAPASAPSTRWTRSPSPPSGRPTPEWSWSSPTATTPTR
jgi:subtilisin family serine protease